MHNILEVSETKFNSNITLKMNNVLDGMNNFYNITIFPDNNTSFNQKEASYIKLIKDIYLYNKNLEKNGDLYIDFYLCQLSSKEYSDLMEKLDDNDKQILESLKKQNFTSKYFLIQNDSILDFFIRLSTRELFFITFYFDNIPLTIWSNFNMKFLIFYNSESALNKITSILIDNNIKYY